MRSISRFFASASLFVFLTGIYSCKLNEIEYDESDSENIQNESVASAYFDDATDLSATSVSSANDTAGGITVPDNRFSCAQVTLAIDAASTFLHPKGILTVDFGSGCTDGRGNIRSGKIRIAYDGRRFLPRSSLTITYDGYTINGVALEGEHKIGNGIASTSDRPVLIVTLTDGKLTWPDGTTATRELSFRREWIRTSNQQDVWHVTGSASGVNRKGKDYSLTITTKLTFQQVCREAKTKLLPSSGVEELIINHKKKISVDFGDGSCDQKVTITINSKSTTEDLSKSL